jgi:uncharacterized membrane protein
MTRVDIAVTVARPADEAFAWLSDFTKAPQWQSGVVEAHFTSAPPLRLGSTYTQRSRFLSRDIVFNFEIIGYEPGRRIEFQTVSGTFPVHIERWVEPVAAGAIIHALIRGDASGLYRLAAPVLDRLTQRQIEGDYQRLKQVLEAA